MMKTVRFSFFSLTLLFATMAFAVDESQDGAYGDQITLSGPISVTDAIAKFNHHQGKEILISGKVIKVCQQKGCWLTLQSDQGDIRMTFKDYGFFVPESLIDKQVLAQGKLHQETMSVATIKHYAQDAGLPQEEIDKIDQPIKEYRFVATAVKIQP